MDIFPAFTKSRGFPYFIFSIYFFLLLAPLWLLTVGPMWDANDYTYPIFTYLADSIREGRFALWDPYTNSGEPFHADPQKMALNPIALLLGLVVKNTFLGFILLWLIYWWWGGIGMLWLARYFGANASGALIAAVSFAFSGFFLGHAEHIPYIIVASWIPWIFGLADKAVATSRISCAVLAAIALGFCALSGGYPMLVAFTGLAVALWLFLRFILLPDFNGVDTRKVTKRAAWVIATLCLMAVITVVIWSPILHAFTVETVGFTDRMTAITSEASLYGSPFSWRAALSLFFPYSTIMFYGVNPINGIDWMLADISMTNAYMGALVIPLSCVWWFKSESKRRPWWLLVFVLFMALVSLGGKAGLRIVLNDVFSFLRLMRFSAPFRLFWIFPLTLSAGLGFSLLCSNATYRSFFAKAIAACLVTMLLVAQIVRVCALGNGIPLMNSIPLIYLPAIVVIPMGLLLAWYWVKRDSARTSKFVVPLFVVLILADMGGHLYINSYTVWTKDHIINFLEKNHVRTTASHEEPWGRVYKSPTGFMNSHIVLKIPVVSGYVAFNIPDFNEGLAKGRFAEVLTSKNRFWLVPGVESKPPGKEALRILSDSGSNGPVPVYLEKPTRLVSSSRITPGSYGALKVSYYSPEEIRLEVQVPGSAGGFLASTERYAAGWNAWIDGVPQKVERNNLFFRGLYLPSGQHTVIWKYQPDWWWPLVILSYSTMFTMIGIAYKQRQIEGR